VELKLNQIITRDMEAMVSDCDSEADRFRALMRQSPNANDWDKWFRKVDMLEQRAARYRAALARRAIEGF
jgi:hypothetical protein